MSAARSIPVPVASVGTPLPSERALVQQRHNRLAALQHQILAAANNATSFEGALKEVLPQICAIFGWLAAHAFVIAEPELMLVPTRKWHFEKQDGVLQRLAKVRAEPLEFNPAEVLAISSLQTSEAPRAILAREIGLSHVVNVVVPAGPHPGGLIEFFSPNLSELDEDEREGLIQVAAHLGRVLERERHASALLRSEGKFRALFECNAVPMFFWNSSKMILDANDALLRLIGFTRAEVERGEVSWGDITPPDQLFKDARAIEALRQTGHCEPYEKNWIRRDGTVLSVVMGRALLPGSKDVGTAVVIDVTELRQTASALRESERRYQLATSAASVSIWELDLHSNIVFSDGVLSGLLGYERDEKTSHEVWMSRIHKADRERVMQHEQAVVVSADRLEDGATPIPPIEFRILNRRGRARWFLNRGLLLRDASDKPYRAIGAITDISEQKRVQQALRTKQQQLHNAYGRVRTLTGRLIHAQEQERLRVAREIHDDLGQRLASLGISLAQIRRHSNGHDELFARAERDVDELARAIRDLSHNLHSAVLEHAGLEAGLRSLADEVHGLGHLQVALKVNRLPSKIPTETSLAAYRIVQEGLRNVQKHSGVSSAKVYVTAANSHLMIQVHDEGRGFNLWERNGRIGLGLISAEERTRLLGGTFSVTSSPGRGTHLSATLPLRAGESSEAA